MKYNFSTVFNKLMEEKNLNNTQLALELEKMMDNPPSKTAIGNWRKGAIVQRKSIIKALCTFFDVDEDYLLGKSTIRNSQKMFAAFDNINIDMTAFEKSIQDATSFFNLFGYNLEIDYSGHIEDYSEEIINGELVSIPIQNPTNYSIYLVSDTGERFLCDNFELLMQEITDYATVRIKNMHNKK